MSKKFFILTIGIIVAVAAATAAMLWKSNAGSKRNSNAITTETTPENIDPRLLPDLPFIPDSRKTKGNYVTIEKAELVAVGHVESKGGSEVVTYTLTPKITLSTDHDISSTRIRKVIIDDLQAKGTCVTTQNIRQAPDFSKQDETFNHMTVTFDILCDPQASYANNVVTRLFGGTPVLSKAFSYAKLTAADVSRKVSFGIVVNFQDTSETVKNFSIILPGNDLIQTTHEIVSFGVDKQTF